MKTSSVNDTLNEVGPSRSNNAAARASLRGYLAMDKQDEPKHMRAR